ncbi:MAG: uL30 family ribosomal protein [Candidatus Micrarchaeota archaeon]|nr:uL30 family ribosomal protein [Candidatus Micrarchaeota archaeon]
MSVLAILRLKGKFSIPPKVKYSLECLNLRYLYSCTFVPNTQSFAGMAFACKDFVSFGEVEKDTIVHVLSKKGRHKDGKRISQAEAEKIAQELESGKTLSECMVQPFVRLSPPKGGFGHRKKPFPFGPKGKNQQISQLLLRMV